jgi:hypothetical protein
MINQNAEPALSHVMQSYTHIRPADNRANRPHRTWFPGGRLP